MKIKTHMLLSLVMLMSAPVIAAENSERGAEKPPAAQRLHMSGATFSANINTNSAAQAATTNAVDKTDMYIPHPDEIAAQKQPQ
jgi:hypothetical protein